MVFFAKNTKFTLQFVANNWLIKMQFSTEIRSEDAALITLCIIMEESAIDVILFTAEL